MILSFSNIQYILSAACPAVLPAYLPTGMSEDNTTGRV